MIIRCCNWKHPDGGRTPAWRRLLPILSEGRRGLWGAEAKVPCSNRRDSAYLRIHIKRFLACWKHSDSTARRQRP